MLHITCHYFSLPIFLSHPHFPGLTFPYPLLSPTIISPLLSLLSSLCFFSLLFSSLPLTSSLHLTFSLTSPFHYPHFAFPALTSPLSSRYNTIPYPTLHILPFPTLNFSLTSCLPYSYFSPASLSPLPSPLPSPVISSLSLTFSLTSVFHFPHLASPALTFPFLHLPLFCPLFTSPQPSPFCCYNLTLLLLPYPPANPVHMCCRDPSLIGPNKINAVFPVKN